MNGLTETPPKKERHIMTTTTSTKARLGAAASATALVAAVGLLTAIGTDSQASVHHERVLRFGVKFSPHNVVDVPPLAKHEGDYHAGDYATFGDVLTNSNGRPLGTEAGSGLITGVSHAGAQIFFSMAIHLHHGDITAAGIGSTAPNKNLVVTGGTGSFLGARGDVHALENGDGTGSLRITLR